MIVHEVANDPLVAATGCASGENYSCSCSDEVSVVFPQNHVNSQLRPGMPVYITFVARQGSVVNRKEP